MAWNTALTSKLPSCLVLSRQNLQQQIGSDERALRGAYVLSREKGSEAQIILMGSGSEVSLLIGAQARLRENGWDARVVSVPSMELFQYQSDEYREQVFPKNIRRRLAVEAGSSMPWYRYVGLDGRVVAMDHFGSSAPAEVLSQQYGFTVEHVLEVAEDMLKV
jgi:transketolase